MVEITAEKQKEDWKEVKAAQETSGTTLSKINIRVLTDPEGEERKDLRKYLKRL